MNRSLMRAVAEFATFLALSPDDAVQPDTAVEQMEQLASVLKGLSTADREVFKTFLAGMSEDERLGGAVDRAEFLAHAFEKLGLEA